MKYETVIGLEVHVELATATKIFCGCENKFGGGPYPLLPRVYRYAGRAARAERKVVEYAVKAGLALNCKIANFSRWTAELLLSRPAQSLPDIAVRPAHMQGRLCGH